ncbi:MAG TPA: DMT family transporter [Planctomycetota bacterium]|jgi:drug/metabolite transporter (DMT)-like permease|nr:DMT family transporter [Planctomycetota bacterium]OQC19402.1 MAG: putative inner membrane transporter YedA [Planctomycetes bacterium ADurb.Bin069]NMD36425.1 DMT family transporter [Planctomycetota bacterium]HNS00586.1 DMT family transporter [Planctomycetota bacterium]HNU27208.1 DMT family transporter [Planctomycetota bacterium]
MRRFFYSGLLLGAVCVWGWTFVVIKDAVACYGVTAFLALRFVLGTLALAPFAARRIDRGTFRAGVIIGLTLVCAYLLQTYGIRATTATNAGLISGLFIVFAPLFNRLLFGVKTRFFDWLAIGLSIAGLLLLAGGGASGRFGDALALVGASLFGLHIALLDRYAVRHRVVGLAFVQVATAAAGFLALWPFVDGFVWPTPKVWFALGVTGLLGTAAGFYIQTLAQRHLSAVNAAAIFFLEPLFAALFGYLLAGDRLTPIQLAGGAIMLAAIAALLRPDKEALTRP